MEKSTRMWLVRGAAACGVLAAISWAVAIYAYSNAPEIHEVVIKAANGGHSVQSKAEFLFAPAIFPTFYFLMILISLIRWKSVVRKAIERAVPKDLWTQPTIGPYRVRDNCQWGEYWSLRGKLYHSLLGRGESRVSAEQIVHTD